MTNWMLSQCDFQHLRIVWVKAMEDEEFGFACGQEIDQFGWIDLNAMRIGQEAHAWMSVPSNVRTTWCGTSNSTSYARPSA